MRSSETISLTSCAPDMGSGLPKAAKARKYWDENPSQGLVTTTGLQDWECQKWQQSVNGQNTDMPSQPGYRLSRELRVL